MWLKLLMIILVLILFFITVIVIDNHRFVVRRYTASSPKIRYPVRLVFIADLHEKSYGKDNERLVETIRELKPDAVLVGGDLIVSGAIGRIAAKNAGSGGSSSGVSMDTGWMKYSLSLVERLSSICDVWFVQGNHELRLSYYKELRDYDQIFRKEMEKAGMRFLKNGSVDPAAHAHGGQDSGVRLRGLELPIRYYKKFRKTELEERELERQLGEADPSVYTILLTHTPVYFEQYAEWGADMSLCGHVHGGLMRLPLIGGVVGTRPNLFPKYSGGQYYHKTGEGGTERTGTLILTCGLGMHTLPIRIFNPGEVSLVELLPEDR